MCRVRLFSLYVFIGLALNGQAQRFGFEALSVEEGLPQAGVYDLVQGPDGALWVATEGGGLARFDGRQFHIFDSESGLPDNTVRCMAIDHNGTLAGGTAEGGVFLISGDSAFVPEPLQALGNKHIRGLSFSPDGSLWVATLEDGVFRMTNNQLVSIESSLPAGTRCRDILCDVKGAIWVATDAGLARILNEKIVSVPLVQAASDPAGATVLDLFSASDGSLWVATEAGVFCLKNDEVHVLNHPDMTGRRVRSVAADARGNMWFGTELGLFRMRITGDFSVADVRFFDKAGGLTNERIRKVLVDDNQILWVGTYFGGVLKLKSEAFAAYGPSEGIDRGNVTCLARLSDGRMAVGYFGGKVMVSDLSGRTETRSYHLASNADVRVNALLQVDARTILACSGLGTFELNVTNGGLRQVSDHQSLDVCRSGNFTWVAASDGLFCYRAGKLSRVTEGSFKSLVPVADSLLLTGDGEHILAIRNPDCGTESRPDTLASPGAALTAGLKLPDGTWWLATDGEGIFQYRNGTLRKQNLSRFLPTSFVNALASDINGNRFAGSKKGLTMLEPDAQNEIILQSYHFDSSNGLPGKEIGRNALLPDPDGIVWVGTISGLQSFDPRMLYSDPSAPVIRLASVLLAYESIVEGAVRAEVWQNSLPVNPVFDHRQNHLTFRVAATDLSGPEDIRFQMMLQGHDPEWLPVGTQREITYAQLKPGSYVFKFRAANKDGVWNEVPEEYAFTIEPPFYAAWWFIAMVVLIAGLVIWAIFRIRTAMLRKENLLLEAKVNERTKQLAEEKEKTDELLLNILPRSVAEELKEKGSAAAQKHQVVTVLFSDFKGFTSLTETLTSDELVALLHQCFTAFDSLCAAYGVEKIKTIGDAYMCATGLPEPDPCHAEKMVRFANEMIRTIHQINRENERHGIPPWLIRIGIHSGPVIAGVVGHRKFAYDIWGDTVNIASRMESNGEPFQINVSEETKKLLGPEFRLSHRGKIEVKNKGPMDMYFVEPNDIK